MRTLVATLHGLALAGMATALGYVTHNPNWLILNAPIGFVLGFLVGQVYWTIILKLREKR